MSVKLIAVTKPTDDSLTAEQLVAFVARVSNPTNQENHKTAPKLLRYLIDHKHWSPFEHVSMTVEIETSRAIAAQILRHRSFCFQEFSQRYAQSTDYEVVEPRRQDLKNRQNSTNDLPQDVREWFEETQKQLGGLALTAYQQALEKGIAKESARFLLPLSTKTTLYMTGSLRSWIHYIEVRAAKETQAEHREIAEGVRAILAKEFPTVAEALGWEVKPCTSTNTDS